LEAAVRILIVKLSAIGDVVHTLPLLETLKWNFPEAKIDWVVEEDASGIIRGHPLLDRVLVSKRKFWQNRLLRGRERSLIYRQIESFLNELRSFRYDLVLDIQGLFKSGIITGVARGERKLGLAGAREMASVFLSEAPVKVDMDDHAVERYLKMADYLLCKRIAWNGRIPFSEAEALTVKSVMEKNRLGQRPVIAFNPVAKWPTKLWSIEGFAEVAEMIRSEFSCDLVFTGSLSDRPVIEEISRLMARPPVILAGRTDLKGLAFFLSRCSALVTTDTGPMHIAAAMGCPVVALFGPTAPWRTGPYGKGNRIVSAKVACSPCFKRHCRHRTCMKDIKSEKVIECVGQVLKEHGVRAVSMDNKQA